MSFGGTHPSLSSWFKWLYQVGEAYGYAPRLTSGYRSIREQASLYDRYRRGESPYPAAAPGCSTHNYGLAVDLVPREDRALDHLGAIWESVGGRWGGRFGDRIHFDVGPVC